MDTRASLNRADRLGAVIQMVLVYRNEGGGRHQSRAQGEQGLGSHYRAKRCRRRCKPGGGCACPWAWSELLQRRGQAVLARGAGGSGKQALSGARGTAGACRQNRPKGGREARETLCILHSLAPFGFPPSSLSPGLGAHSRDHLLPISFLSTPPSPSPAAAPPSPSRLADHGRWERLGAEETAAAHGQAGVEEMVATQAQRRWRAGAARWVRRI